MNAFTIVEAMSINKGNIEETRRKAKVNYCVRQAKKRRASHPMMCATRALMKEATNNSFLAFHQHDHKVQ